MNKKFLITSILGVLLLIVFGLSLVVWTWSQLQPVQPSLSDSTRFVVTKGQSLTSIANALHEAGLIKQSLVFRYYVQFEKLDTKIQAGSYEINPGMSMPEVARILTQGTEDLWITLPEGWRREEVAEYLSNQELTNFDKTEFLTLTEDKEGYLFPDTYLIARESTTEQIYSLLIATFDKKVAQGLSAEIAASSLTEPEVIALASIVEREGSGEQDMRRVAGILLNRLEIGMALETDANLQYISGQDSQGNWWSPPSVSVKQSTSPYNTYKYPGLPPGAISNPGLQAIKAVLDPIPSDDLFYIHALTGEPHYSASLEEHNANINKYLR